MVLLRKALWANARQVCKLHCLHGHPVAAACDRERARLQAFRALCVATWWAKRAWAPGRGVERELKRSWQEAFG